MRRVNFIPKIYVLQDKKRFADENFMQIKGYSSSCELFHYQIFIYFRFK